MKLFCTWLDWALPVRFKYQPAHDIPGAPLKQCAGIVVQLGPISFVWRFL